MREPYKTPVLDREPPSKVERGEGLVVASTDSPLYKTRVLFDSRRFAAATSRRSGAIAAEGGAKGAV